MAYGGREQKGKASYYITVPAAALRSAARRDGASTAILEGEAGGDRSPIDPRKSSRTSCDARRRRSACSADASSSRAKTAARTTLNRSRNAATSDAKRFRASVTARSASNCVEINQCVGYIATPSSRRRVDGVEDDAAIQHERAVKF